MGGEERRQGKFFIFMDFECCVGHLDEVIRFRNF